MIRLKNIYVLASVLVFSRFLVSRPCGAQLSAIQHEIFDDESSKNYSYGGVNIILHIGLIVNMQSSVAKIVVSCVNMAISDVNNGLCGRQKGVQIVLHPRDSKGEALGAILAAKDLTENMKVDAIIVPQMTSEASMMATLGDKANVPILSFTSVPLMSNSHPYFLQITEEENTLFKGIISILERFKWRKIVLIHEDADDGRNVLPHLLEQFQEKSIHVIYKNAISFSVKGDQLIEEFDKLKMMQTSVFVVHASPSLSSKIFTNSKRLGMMDEGYAWLVTDRTMNFFEFLDPFVIESMKGVLGFKSYIPASTRLRNFTLRWRRYKRHHIEPNQNIRNLNVLGIRAYDTVYALAKATISLGSKFNFNNSAGKRAYSYGSEFLGEILKSEFTGLGGDFRLVNGKLVFKGYEVVNIIGKEERRVGYWTIAHGFTKDISFNNLGLDTIFWPGFSVNPPKGFLFQAGGTRLKVVFPANALPECMSVQNDTQNDKTIVTGFCKDVFDAALESLGYDVPYDLVPFEIDQHNHTISFNHLVYQVYLKKYDAAIGDITITSNRSLYVDFTLPFSDLGMGTVVQSNTKDRWFFLKPLDRDLWITIACFFVLLGVIIWLIEHPINKDFQGSRPQQIGTIFWFSISTLVYAHKEKLESNLSKFVVGIWLFVVFILASSYTAILSSRLTVQQIQLARGDNIGYLAGSYAQQTIVNNLNFDYDAFKSFDSFDKYNDALSRGSDKGGVDALVGEIPYLKSFLKKYPSDHAMSTTSSTTNGFGFAFQKGSPLVPDISRAIAKLREDETLSELEKKWFSQDKRVPTLSPQGYERFEPRTLGLGNFLGLFFLSGLSKIIALLILLIFFVREKLSLNYGILRVIKEGKLIGVMKHLLPRMVKSTDDGNLPR